MLFFSSTLFTYFLSHGFTDRSLCLVNTESGRRGLRHDAQDSSSNPRKKEEKNFGLAVDWSSMTSVMIISGRRAL